MPYGKRIGINRNDRKDSRQESKRKAETNDVTIHGRRSCTGDKWRATCCKRSKKVEGHDDLRPWWVWYLERASVKRLNDMFTIKTLPSIHGNFLILFRLVDSVWCCLLAALPCLRMSCLQIWVVDRGVVLQRPRTAFINCQSDQMIDIFPKYFMFYFKYVIISRTVEKGGRGGKSSRVRALKGLVNIFCHRNYYLCNSAVHFYDNSSASKEYLQRAVDFDVSIHVTNQTVVFIFLF